MTDMSPATAAENAFEREVGFPRLSHEQISVPASVGLRRAVTKGELLYRAGDATYDFYVVTSGRIAIVDHHGRGGHFAAWEQPQLLSQEIRAAFRSVR